MKQHMHMTLLAAGLLLAAGCQDLVVENNNDPDRTKALAQPDAVELLAASTYPRFYNRIYRGTAGYVPLPMTADEATNSDNTSGARDLSTIPRRPFDNNPVNDVQYALVTNFWGDFYESYANATEALRIINDGLVIETGTPAVDNTHRLRVFAKLMQGFTLGYIGLIFDQAFIYDETTPEEKVEDPVRFGLGLSPYQDVIAKSIALLAEAEQLARSGPDFTVPMVWLYAPADVTRNDIIEMTHAYRARFLTLAGRTPTERAATNWQAVLTHTAAVTKDIRVAFGASSTGQNNNYVAKAHSTSSTTRWYAAIPHIGPADTSGAYQAWLAKPVEQRTRFLIATPDRRITGATPTTNGRYFRYLSQDLLNAIYGTYRQSYYQWMRYYSVVSNGATSGTFAVVPLDEMRLYRAEAYIRTTGQSQLGVDIINATRANGSLPQVTVNGVTQSTGCVPRTKAGACGSLLDALAYERSIELMFVDPIRGWADKRGFGQLTSGTVLHLPIPYAQQRILDMEYYTFGGSGPGSAQ
jgi:hypothetical protein